MHINCSMSGDGRRTLSYKAFSHLPLVRLKQSVNLQDGHDDQSLKQKSPSQLGDLMESHFHSYFFSLKCLFILRINPGISVTVKGKFQVFVHTVCLV